jgi:hypothetical protein
MKYSTLLLDAIITANFFFNMSSQQRPQISGKCPIRLLCYISCTMYRIA